MTAHSIRALLGGLLLCAAAAMAADGARNESASPAGSVPPEDLAPPAEGPTHLPAIEARDLSGRPVRRVHRADRHTLLTFYFSTCVPCIQEVPALNAYREAHPELNYVAITFDLAADARRFVSERKLNWPVVADAGRFLREAGIRSFPAYMLVAPDGRIIGRGAGLALNAREKTPGLAALERFVSRQLKAPE
jgi:thiol-disulfide isomerase/thioredoxin